MKKPTTSTPHDAVFKKFLSHPETARDFLDSYLPAPLRELCDLNTLKLEPGSFIEEDLRASYSDVLWSLKTRTGKGYIYALIEHQSSPDAHMAFRMMRYAIAAMQNHLDAGHKTLPLVVPILFTMALPARTLIRCAGWMSLTIQRLRGIFMERASRWSISRWCLMMRLCSTGEWHYWNLSRSIYASAI